MKILLSPQFGIDDSKFTYSFDGEIITATLNGGTDVFDFTGMPDGIANAITSTLITNPIISAKRVDNILWVELLNFIGVDATHEERFPEWIDSESYVPEAPKTPVEELSPPDEQISTQEEIISPALTTAVESDSGTGEPVAEGGATIG